MHRIAHLASTSPFQSGAHVVVITFFLCCVVSVQGCTTTSAAEVDKIDAQSAVITWLNLLDRKDYQTTYNSTASFFKDRVTLNQWQEQVSQARSALGQALSRRPVTASYTNKLTDTPTGDYVIFQFQTEFTGQSRAVETVTLALDKGTWRTVGYFVR